MEALLARPTIGDALVAAVARLANAGVPEPRADAEVLLAHALGGDRTSVVASARRPLAAAAAVRFDALVARRTTREPVAYLTGTREFWSMPLAVDRRVLIPRPETELVVETALRVAPHARRVLDVGTGSGAIAAALARELAGATVLASDRVPDALAVARANCARFAPGVRLVCADLLAPFRAAAFDLVVSNPPYCAEGSVPQPEVRDHEPAAALFAGADGLDVLRRLVARAADVLVPGGWLVVELGIGQAAAVARQAEEDGRYGRAAVERDLAGIERVLAMRRRDGRGVAWTRS